MVRRVAYTYATLRLMLFHSEEFLGVESQGFRDYSMPA